MFEWRKEKPVFNKNGTLYYNREDLNRKSTPEELTKIQQEVLEASNKNLLLL